MRFFLVVTLINLFQVVVAAAAEASNPGGLVDIGRGRKIYPECRGTGSPTVVLISGTRGAHDDWTDLIDLKNPNSAPKPGEHQLVTEINTAVCVFKVGHRESLIEKFVGAAVEPESRQRSFPRGGKPIGLKAGRVSLSNEGHEC